MTGTRVGEMLLSRRFLKASPAPAIWALHRQTLRGSLELAAWVPGTCHLRATLPAMPLQLKASSRSETIRLGGGGGGEGGGTHS